MNNKVITDEQIQQIVEKQILEQKVSDLENTLSNTMDFFGTTFGFAGLVLALLLGIIGWWMNRVFNSKLDKLGETEQEVKNILTNIKDTEERIKELHLDVKKNTRELKSVLELQKKLSGIERMQNFSTEFQDEVALIQRYMFKSILIILENEECIFKIKNNSELIKKYFNDSFEGSPFEQFARILESYSNWKDNLFDICKYENDLENYIFNYDENVEKISESIIGYYEEIEEINKKLKKILSKH